MILPVIVITIATTVVSMTFVKTPQNVSSLIILPPLRDDVVNDSDDSIPVPDIEQENICKRVVIFNSTRLITFRVERRQKCSLSTENCNEDGYERTSSVGYRNLTKTERLSELVCCEGFKNESGKCVKDVTSFTINNTSGMTERELKDETTVLMIALPVAGTVIVLVIFAVVVYKIRHCKKRPRDRSSDAHGNPMYDSSVGQTNMTEDNACPNNEQSNRVVRADANIYHKI